MSFGEGLLWVLTLPLFFASYVFMQLFEGLLWLIHYPGRSWAQLKEWLGGN